MIIAVVTKPFTACSCVGHPPCLEGLSCLCFHCTRPHSCFLPHVVNGHEHGCQRETLLSFVCLCVWQRSTSLEVSVTTRECAPDVQSSRLSPSLACTRRKRRSQSIPAELAAPSTSPYAERPAGCTHGQEAGAVNKVTLNHTAITCGEEVKLSWQIEYRWSPHWQPTV